MGRLEKTDAIDASMIAQYASVRKSQPMLVAPRAQQQLRAQVTRLRQLTSLRTAQRNQARLIDDPVIQRSFTELLKLIETQIEQLETAIAALSEASRVLCDLRSRRTCGFSHLHPFGFVPKVEFCK